MAKIRVEPLIYDTYLAVIKNSVGSKVFRNFYAKVGGQKKDITKEGELSCAWYASSILNLFRLLQKPHATVNSTVRDLKQSGWKRIKKPKIGSVLVWEEIDFGEGDIHKHIGFYIGKEKAISNSAKLSYPVMHHWTFGREKGKPKRKIEAIFWHPKLG